jgi:hypothetical protein
MTKTGYIVFFCASVALSITGGPAAAQNGGRP